MNIAELKTKIVVNEIPNILVFTGEEIGIMDIYIKAIQDKLKYQVSKIDTVLDAFNLSSGRSIFKVNKLFICVDDLTFLKQEQGWDNLSKVLGDNKIILDSDLKVLDVNSESFAISLNLFDLELDISKLSAGQMLNLKDLQIEQYSNFGSEIDEILKKFLAICNITSLKYENIYLLLKKILTHVSQKT